MLYIIFLFMTLVFLSITLSRTLELIFAKKRATARSFKDQIKAASRINKDLKEEIFRLSKELERTLALYDITKGLRQALEGDKIFAIFRDNLSRYLEAGDCQFVAPSTNLKLYKDYSVFPLKIDRNISGYLLVKDIKGEDKERFTILAQQFFSAMKRAILYKEVQELSVTDSLTNVFNRRYFMDRLAEEIKRSEEFGYGMGFLMVDIDNFKSYNDRYGHLVGDVILKEVTATIKESVRQMDFIGRYGGEELVAVLAETDKQKAYFIAERIRQAVEAKEIKAYDEDVKVTISIGVATLPESGASTEALVEGSDQALYLAKQTGKNRVCSMPLDKK